MARYSGPVCRLCRREGEKLFLKGERCYTQKCAMERRDFGPGMQSKRRSKPSDYGTQLREKQALKRVYGMLERQFHLFFRRASQRRGVTGEALLQMLERRLDNVVFRAGFSLSRSQGRQFVRHGHVLLNGRGASIPSLQVKTNDVVEVRSQERSRRLAARHLELSKNRPVPEWIMLDAAGYRVTVAKMPTKGEIGVPVNEQLVVELYSR